jgi:hypothetical protein
MSGARTRVVRRNRKRATRVSRSVRRAVPPQRRGVQSLSKDAVVARNPRVWKRSQAGPGAVRSERRILRSQLPQVEVYGKRGQRIRKSRASGGGKLSPSRATGTRAYAVKRTPYRAARTVACGYKGLRPVVDVGGRVVCRTPAAARRTDRRRELRARREARGMGMAVPRFSSGRRRAAPRRAPGSGPRRPIPPALRARAQASKELYASGALRGNPTKLSAADKAKVSRRAAEILRGGPRRSPRLSR